MVAIKAVVKLIKRAPTLYASQCYPAANIAVEIYQSLHLVTPLCAETGQFAKAIFYFEECTSSHPVSDGAGLADVSLAEPLSYCASLGITDLTEQVAIAYSSSSSSESSSRSSACASYASQGILGPQSLQCTLTLSNGAVESWAIVTASTDYDLLTSTALDSTGNYSSVAPSTITAYITQSNPTQIPLPTADDRPSTGVIAGIAVGATIAVILILSMIGFLAWRLRRKRKSRREAEAAAATVVANSGDRTEKSQLHSDDYKPHREEAEGSKVPLNIREIAGLHEIETQGLSKVRTEMSANEVAASELDSPDRARLSPTADSSTLLGSSARSESGR